MAVAILGRDVPGAQGLAGALGDEQLLLLQRADAAGDDEAGVRVFPVLGAAHHDAHQIGVDAAQPAVGCAVELHVRLAIWLMRSNMVFSVRST